MRWTLPDRLETGRTDSAFNDPGQAVAGAALHKGRSSTTTQRGSAPEGSSIDPMRLNNAATLSTFARRQMRVVDPVTGSGDDRLFYRSGLLGELNDAGPMALNAGSGLVQRVDTPGRTVEQSSSIGARATALNRAGVVAGSRGNDGFVYEDGAFTAFRGDDQPCDTNGQPISGVLGGGVLVSAINELCRISATACGPRGLNQVWTDRTAVPLQPDMPTQAVPEQQSDALKRDGMGALGWAGHRGRHY